MATPGTVVPSAGPAAGYGAGGRDDGRLLEIDGLDVSLGRRWRSVPILHDVALRVAPGEIVGLVGETGSGKTTLARTVLGLVDPTAGTVRVSGTVTSQLRGRARRSFRRAGAVQFVFQDPLRSLDPDLLVADIVGEGLAIRAELSASERSARVATAIDQVGLDATVAGRHPAQLSGGQRQRVSIARALAGGPRLLVCDEPVSALDASSRNQILRLLDGLRRDLGIGILVISHDLSSLAGITDRIAVLYRGRVLEDGSTDRVLGAPLHPYTALLVASAPSVRHDRDLLAGQLRRSESDPPAPDGPDACVFASRCPFATEVCGETPPLATGPDGVSVACHHAGVWHDAAVRRDNVAAGGASIHPVATAHR